MVKYEVDELNWWTVGWDLDWFSKALIPLTITCLVLFGFLCPEAQEN